MKNMILLLSLSLTIASGASAAERKWSCIATETALDDGSSQGLEEVEVGRGRARVLMNVPFDNFLGQGYRVSRRAAGGSVIFVGRGFSLSIDRHSRVGTLFAHVRAQDEYPALDIETSVDFTIWI
jgi:hypothetical protein